MEESTPCQKDIHWDFQVICVRSDQPPFKPASLPDELLKLQLGLGESLTPFTPGKGCVEKHSSAASTKVDASDEAQHPHA